MKEDKQKKKEKKRKERTHQICRPPVVFPHTLKLNLRARKEERGISENLSFFQINDNAECESKKSEESENFFIFLFQFCQINDNAESESKKR